MFTRATASVFALVFTIFLVVYLSWPAFVLWGWFAVPLGLPAVSMAHMLGIIMLTGLLNGALLDKLIKDGDNDMSKHKLLKILSAPLIVVGLGYVVKLVGGL